MDSILEKNIVLSLNANWFPVGHRTVKQAIISMTGGLGTPPALALDIQMDENGTLISAIPTKWDDWVNLPVRASDLSITTKNGRIRAPTVIVTGYRKMPVKRPRLTSRAVLERDNYTCQYSGKKLTKNGLNIDHIVPKSRGGKDDWTNMVACDRKLNSQKGGSLNSEINLRLIRRPLAPPSLPVSSTIRDARHPTHLPFLPAAIL